MGKPTYMQRLRSHPGVPTATTLTVVFPLAGLLNEQPATGVVAGLIAATSVWLIVLITARTQPVSPTHNGGESDHG